MVIGSSVLIHKFSQTPWAIHPSMFETFNTVINNKLDGLDIRATDKVRGQDKYDDDDGRFLLKYDIYGNTAVIPMHGVILKKSMGMQGMSGLVATLDMEASFKSALENRDVERIILDIDSPGGTVDGTMEMSDLIYNSRGKKPIIAFANGMACSGAYWIGSAADEFYTYHTSFIGSIGVYMMHVDQSAANEADGYKVTYIKAGKYKTAGNPNEPLSDMSKEVLQNEVDNLYTQFTIGVARNRGIAHEEILKIAEGKVYIGQEAVDAGLVDGLESFDDILAHSNIYSFLKGEQMLGMKVKDAKVADVKSENSEVYNEIFNAGCASRDEEVATLTAKNNELKNAQEQQEAATVRETAIMSNAVKLNQEEYGKELVAGNDSVEEAYAKLIDKSSECAGSTRENFAATAPKPAGSADGGDLLEEAPKTGKAAKEYCEKKYNLTGKAAWNKAKNEFPGLFYNTDGGK